MENNNLEITCTACGIIFISGLTDEMAQKEAKNRFPDTNINDMVLVCDDCYIEICDYISTLN